MKWLNIIIPLLAMLCAARGEGESDVRTAGENERLSHWEELAVSASDIKQEDDHGKIEMLAQALRGIGSPSGYSPPTAVRAEEIYRRVQDELLSMPGHADYFATELEKHRQAAQGEPGTDKIAYDRWRASSICETLGHMPSPETIRVLGQLLYDERDVPPSARFVPENAYLAAIALSQIGLRDAPFPPMSDYLAIRSIPEWRESLPRFREWFSEVKAGERTFSFVGRDESFEFNEDGTWETTSVANPADDSPAGGRPDTGPTKTADEAIPEQGKNAAGFGRRGWWAGILLVVVVFAAGWIRWFRRAH